MASVYAIFHRNSLFKSAIHDADYSSTNAPAFDKYIYAGSTLAAAFKPNGAKMRYAEYATPNLLQDAYDCYRRNNLVISQRAFSRRILGQAPSYYSCMKTRDFKPSRKVMETLLSVTKTILATFIGNPHFGKSYAVNLNHAYEELEDLAQRIAVQLEMPLMLEKLGRL